MKYYTLMHDLRKTMCFSSPEIYDSNHNEFQTRDFKIEGSFKEKFKEPLSVVLHEPTSSYQKNGELTDILNLSFPSNIPCISDRARSILESLNLPLEYLKVQIKGKKIEILEGYQLALVLGNPIPCLNKELTIATYMDSGILYTIDKLVFDESKIPEGTKIFLLADLFDYMPWINDQVVNKLQENNLTGFKFVEVGEYKEI